MSGLNHLTANEAHRKVPESSNLSLSANDGRGVPRWDAGPENQSVSEILAQAGSTPVSSAICKRRRKGMAPVRKTGALRSQWVRSPPLAPMVP